MDQMDEWAEQPTQEISVSQMDELIKNLKAHRELHAKAKEESAKAHALLEEVEKLVLNTLKACGKRKYEVDGIGMVYTSVKETYATPKTVDAKKKLFDYIKEKHGPEALMGLVGINHQTLNSWAAKEVDADPQVQIPGLEAPTSEEILNFRKKS